MALYKRIWIAITLVNALVLIVFVALATLQFGNISAALVGERLAVLANRTAAPFAAAARIGLPLSSVRNAAALLERARQTDRTIAAIHVFEAGGRVVHSTAARPPEHIPAAALQALAAQRDTPWHAETAEGFLGGIALPTRDGRLAGGILVVYPASAGAAQVWAMAAELALTAFVVALFAGLAGFVLLRLGLTRQIAEFGVVEQTIADFEFRSWRTAAGHAARDTEFDATELHELLVGAEKRYRAAGRALARAAGDPR